MVVDRRGWLSAFSIFLLFGVSRFLPASTLADSQARQAQTAWCLAQVEANVRSQPESSVPVPNPEALSSYVALLSENVTATLTVFASARVTDEQRRIIAEGLRTIARMLRDEISLANNRGLTSAAASLAVLESSCRAVLASP